VHFPTPPGDPQAASATARADLWAWVGPFALFMGFLALASLIGKFAQDLPRPAFLLSNPEYWIFPVQTLACGWLLARHWHRYDFHGWTALPAGLLAGILAFLIWIAPREWLGGDPRMDGFNPELFVGNPVAYWTTLGFRLVRLVVIVPLLEEIFWRGFLMRYLIRNRFTSVPFGTYAPLAFLAVAGAFALVHDGADRIPALLTGLLWNALAVRTRSLGACVLAHAVTNLLLGIYILRTGQWGFW
jgi:CAAX prenyl protease-like protein